MKKKQMLILVFALIFAVVAALFIGTGSTKRTDVYLVDYSISEDNSSIILNIAVAASMGYIRDCNVKLDGFNKYITFYPCFGGFNSNIGEKNEFEIDIDPNCDEIYFYHGGGGYTLVLQKNEITNEWEKAK